MGEGEGVLTNPDLSLRKKKKKKRPFCYPISETNCINCINAIY